MLPFVLPCDCALELERRRAAAALQQAGQGEGGRRGRGDRDRGGASVAGGPRWGSDTGGGVGGGSVAGRGASWGSAGGTSQTRGGGKDSGRRATAARGKARGKGPSRSGKDPGGRGVKGSGGANNESDIDRGTGSEVVAWGGARGAADGNNLGGMDLDTAGTGVGSSGRSGSWGQDAKTATGSQTRVVQNFCRFCAEVYDYCGPGLLWNGILALLLLSMYGKRYLDAHWQRGRTPTTWDGMGEPTVVKACCASCPCNERLRVLKPNLKWPPADYECRKMPK